MMHSLSTPEQTDSVIDNGRITVTATATHEVEADHADLTVEIRGASLFNARTASTKAGEVAQLIADLKRVVGSEIEGYQPCRLRTLSRA